MEEINKIIANAIETESYLKAYVIIKDCEKSIKAILEQIGKLAYAELSNISEKDYSINGKKLNCVSKTNWDFKHIKVWQEKTKELSEIEEKAKAAAKFSLDANSETGEQIEPAIATYSNYIKIG